MDLWLIPEIWLAFLPTIRDISPTADSFRSLVPAFS
jgi:hypothetical protein